MFRALSVQQFAPFQDGIISFPAVEEKPPELAEVHLFTGINGTGKSRLLSLLAGILGNQTPLKKRGVDAGRIHFVDTDSYPSDVGRWSGPWGTVNQNGLYFHSGGKAHDWADKVPAFAYSGTTYITDAVISIMADVPKPTREVCLDFTRPESQSAPLLQAIANLKIQVALDSVDETDAQTDASRATRIIRALEGAISKITGRRFAFQITSYPKPVLGVRWGGESLPFNGLPDGLRSIVGWLAHAVVMMDALLEGKGSPLNTEAVFLLDEIETALHPAWQRKILPAFQSLFPKAQMFIATHSPFLISSLNHGWIHQLSLEKDGKVKAQSPKAASEGDSYVTVVEDIMGVKEWFDPETENLLSDFRSKRNAAYHGDPAARESALVLAGQIGERSMELHYMMGREINQMERQLAKLK